MLSRKNNWVISKPKEMDAFSKMQKNSGSQASSHMLWFFLVPSLAFMIWAGWKLVGGLKKGPETQEAHLITSLSKVEKARSSGDRWHAAYNFAHALQRQQVSGDFDRLAQEERTALFEKMNILLNKFPEDIRLQRYLLLTLGQLSHPDSLPIFLKFLESSDSELRFYGAWGMIETLVKNKNLKADLYNEKILALLKDKDPSMKKIASAYLVQQKNNTYTSAVKALLKDQDPEVQWNSAVVLASVGDNSGKDILKSLFEISNLHTIKYRSAKDLEQIVASAINAARKLGDPEILSQAESLKNSLKPTSPENRAILAGLR
ncbi:MAG: HEAT repeat domain-containing protein [Proteobacteria bacterium]|nr:HEAT repeat domain-containing protein [Pseudomonadota bacterium]